MQLENVVNVEIPMSTYLKFFGKERLLKVEFRPLIQREKGEYSMYKNEIDYRKYKGEERYDLLFKFFSQNYGEKIEVGTIYGFSNDIFGKSVFIMNGRLEDSWIKPMEFIENTYCQNYFDFRNIYYAKCVE